MDVEVRAGAWKQRTAGEDPVAHSIPATPAKWQPRLPRADTVPAKWQPRLARADPLAARPASPSRWFLPVPDAVIDMVHHALVYGSPPLEPEVRRWLDQVRPVAPTFNGPGSSPLEPEVRRWLEQVRTTAPTFNGPCLGVVPRVSLIDAARTKQTVTQDMKIIVATSPSVCSGTPGVTDRLLKSDCAYVGACAAGGAVAIGCAGGVAGFSGGATAGAAAGVVGAVFTFGLSIPIGTVIGGGIGLCAGASAGSVAGALGGIAFSLRRLRQGEEHEADHEKEHERELEHEETNDGHGWHDEDENSCSATESSASEVMSMAEHDENEDSCRATVGSPSVASVGNSQTVNDLGA